MALSEYEQLRQNNIERNALMLKQLGITDIVNERKLAAAKKRVQKEKTQHSAVRKSARAQHMPAPVYDAAVMGVEEDKHAEDMDSKREEDIRLGFRTKAGKWRGEQWGAVKGVEPGACFGRGDFQRKGRQEMQDTGFFVPFVDPEWKERMQRGCYAIILNNDNSTSGSKDSGDVVLYAGSGGRNRGQNRQAPQVCENASACPSAIPVATADGCWSLVHVQ